MTKLIDTGAGSLVRLTDPKFPKEYIEQIHRLAVQKEEIEWPTS